MKSPHYGLTKPLEGMIRLHDFLTMCLLYYDFHFNMAQSNQFVFEIRNDIHLYIEVNLIQL